MKKTTKVITASIISAVAAAAIIIGITLTAGGGADETPIETPVATATETPAPSATPTDAPDEGEEVMGFDEYNAKFTESHTFAAGEVTVATAGEITRDCGSEPVAFEGAILSGYTVVFSDEAHTNPIEIGCNFDASTDALEDAGFEGLND